MLHDLIAAPKAAVTTHGAPAIKDAIRACVDAALLAQVRDACHKAGLSLLSINAQRRISELIVGGCNTCGRVDVEVSGGLLRSHLRKVGDPDGGACLGSGEAPVAAVVAVPVVEPDPFGDLPVVEAPPEDVHAVAARLGWVLEVIQDLGGRSEQQDRWAVVEVGGALLAVVADGMGGHHGGAEAAERAVAAFVETVRKHGASLSALRTALYTADAALAPHGRRAPGTTLTALLLTHDAALLCHAGDSAALRWDGNGWVDVTIRHGAGNIVDLCLGGGGLESSELTPQLEPLPPSDVWLLCSDGLVPDIGRGGLWSGGSLRRLAPADLGADTLGRSLAAAREAGSTDNATAILLRRTVAAPPEKTREEDRAEAARELSEWTNSEPAEAVDAKALAWTPGEVAHMAGVQDGDSFSYDTAEGEPVKMSCPLCRDLVDARRWRIGQPLYALRRHGVCSQIGRTLPAVATGAESEPPAPAAADIEAALSEIEPTPLTPRQTDLLPRLLDVQSVSFEARQLLDEPRWSDTGEPVEDDATLLREALRLETAGKNRSSYTADFERKLSILNDGRRLPKRGREAVTVEREPVNSEPLAGEEMPEVEPRSFEDVWREDYPTGSIPDFITVEDFNATTPEPVPEAVNFSAPFAPTLRTGNARSSSGGPFGPTVEGERLPWIHTESIAITGDMAPTSATDLPTSATDLPTISESRPDAARALAKTIRPDLFTPEGGYTRGEVMTYRRAWELGISEVVPLEPFTTPDGRKHTVDSLPEPACNFPMDGTEPHAKALVLEMVPHGDGGWVKWHRVPRQVFACTENVPAEITPAQARLYLGRLTDGEAVRAVRGYMEKSRGEDDLPHPIATPEPDPVEGATSPKITLSVEGAEAFQIAALKAQIATLELRAAQQAQTINRLQEIVSESERRVVVPEGWTALDEDGCDLADYRAQILDIDDCLNTVDPDNHARSEDDTTAAQVISILRRMVDGSEDLAAALQPTADGVKATLVELGGTPPRAVFVADVSRKTAQRLGKSPGLYGRVVVMLKGDPS